VDFRRISIEEALVHNWQVLHDVDAENANKRIPISYVMLLGHFRKHLFNYLLGFVLFDPAHWHDHGLSPAESVGQDGAVLKGAAVERIFRFLAGTHRYIFRLQNLILLEVEVWQPLFRLEL